MAGSGVIVTGLGITFIIKSTQKKKTEEPSLVIKPWLPNSELRNYEINRP